MKPDDLRAMTIDQLIFIVVLGQIEGVVRHHHLEHRRWQRAHPQLDVQQLLLRDPPALVGERPRRVDSKHHQLLVLVGGAQVGGDVFAVAL